jgi:eukaryotic-like serine/threonine-protein kinase
VQKRDSGEAVADVNLNFASEPIDPDSSVPTEKVGHVTIAEVLRGGNECVRNLQLADDNQIWITVKKIRSPAPDLCAIAQAATDHAVKVLNRGPVPRRQAPFPANSLARVYACELLGTNALSVIPGIDAQDPHHEFGDWGCEWRSTTTEAGIDLGFSQDDDLTDDGQPTRLGGKRSYVASQEAGDDTCVVRTEHRSYTDAAGESTIELVMLTVSGPQPYNELCDTAKALATEVAKKLPKP